MKKCIIILVLVVLVTNGFSYPMDFYNTPICAKFQGYYKTFPNIQALMWEIKYTGNVWCLVKLAECHNIYNSCPLEYNPICAYSEVLNQFKTFPNQCLMNIEMYTTGIGWIAAFPFVCPRYLPSYPIYSQSYINPSYESMIPSTSCATTTISPNRQQTNSSVMSVQVAGDALDPEILIAENSVATTTTTTNTSEEFEQSDNESSTLLSSEPEVSAESTDTPNAASTTTDTTEADEMSTTTEEPSTDATEDEVEELSTITEELTTDTTEDEELSTTITEEPTTDTTEAEEVSTSSQETLQTDQVENQMIKSFKLLSSEQEISTENPSTSTDTTEVEELSTITEELTTDTTEADEISTITEEPTTDTTEAEELSTIFDESTTDTTDAEEISTITEEPTTNTTEAEELSTTFEESTTDTTEADEQSTITEEPTTDTTEADELSTIAEETLQTDQDDNQLVKSFKLLSSEQEITTENPATATATTEDEELSTITEESTTDTTEADELSTITEEPSTDTTEAEEISTITEEPTTDTTEADELSTIADETLQTDQDDNQLIKSFKLLSSEQEITTENPATLQETTEDEELSAITEEATASTTEATTTASATISVVDANNQFIKSFKLLSSEQEISTENPATSTTSTYSPPQSRLLAVISQPIQTESAPITRTNQYNTYNGPYAERDFYHQPIHNYYNCCPLNASLAHSHNTTQFPFANSPLVGPNSRSPYMGQFLYGPYAHGIPVFPINSLVIVNFNDWLNFVRGLQN